MVLKDFNIKKEKKNERRKTNHVSNLTPRNHWTDSLKSRLSKNSQVLVEQQDGNTMIRLPRQKATITISRDGKRATVEAEGLDSFKVSLPKSATSKVDLLYAATLRTEMLRKGYSPLKARNHSMVLAGLGDYWEGDMPSPNALGVYCVG